MHGTSNRRFILCKVREDLRQDYPFGVLGALGALGALGVLGALGALGSLGVLGLLGALGLLAVSGVLGASTACADWLSVINAGAA